MDDLDHKILLELQKNARLPFRKIAETHGVSIGTVHNRIKKLKENGILKGFIPVLDSQKLGYTITAITYIQVDGGYFHEIAEKLMKFDEINVIFQTSGIYSILLIARFKSIMDFTRFNNEIAKLNHIKAETNIVLDTLKDEYFVKLKSQELKL
ncbi:MAG: Lrp/AsnC family transcriptional regulator [Promethearchaeota archaeon]